MTDLKRTNARDLLMHTLTGLLQKKSFQKITVNELCEAAHVSRSAFYANFEDKYHLLSCCLESTTEQMDAMLASSEPVEFHVFALDFIQKNDRIFYNAFHSELDNGTMAVLYRFFERHLKGILEQKAAQGKILPEPLNTVCAFYIGGLITATLMWIRSGYKTPKEQVANCLSSLLKDIL